MVRAASLGVLATLMACHAAAADPRPASMAVGQPALAPFGFVQFCSRLPAECLPSAGPAVPPVRLDAETLRMVAVVNRDVNLSVRAVPDMEATGVAERWDYPTDVGDCEDIALRKRRVLLDRGIAAANLLMTVVRQSNGEGHAVLTLRGDLGDFVLDNLDMTVRDWRDTRYRFVKRQSSEHAGRWVSLETVGGTFPTAGVGGR